MVHKDPSQPDSNPEIKQVEFNTIASSFGGLAAKVSGLHRQGIRDTQFLLLLNCFNSHLLSISAYPSTVPTLITKSFLPSNPSIASISQGLATAHRAYAPSKSHPPLPLCIVFVVQDPENNVFDQHALASTLLADHNILTFRLPFSATLAYTSIPSDNPSRP